MATDINLICNTNLTIGGQVAIVQCDGDDQNKAVVTRTCSAKFKCDVGQAKKERKKHAKYGNLNTSLISRS